MIAKMAGYAFGSNAPYGLCGSRRGGIVIRRVTSLPLSPIIVVIGDTNSPPPGRNPAPDDNGTNPAHQYRHHNCAKEAVNAPRRQTANAEIPIAPDRFAAPPSWGGLGSQSRQVLGDTEHAQVLLNAL
jgi:hypothetical protein